MPSRPLDQPYTQLWVLTADPPESLVAGDSAYARFRMRAFGAGAAAAWILTRLGRPWRPALDQGASFETLLDEAAGVQPGEDQAQLIADAKVRFGYSALLADADRWRATSTEVTEADFYKLRPYRLTVSFPAIGKEQAPGYSVSHSGLATVPEEELLIFADTRAASVTYGPVKLKSEENPILVDNRRPGEGYAFVLMMKVAPKVSGFEKGRGGRIVGSGVELETNSPARIDRLTDGLTITVEAPPPAS